MKSLRIFGIVILTVCLFIVLLSLDTYAESKTASVTVVNTPANPVPVNASVTGNVSISNTVPVMNVNNPDKENIFSGQMHIILRGNAEAWVSDLTIPDGFRLILEHVSVKANMPSGQQLVNLQVGGTSLSKSSYLFAAFQGSSGSIDHYIASQPIKLRLDSGDTLTFAAARNTSGSVPDATVTLYYLGYWIEYP